MKKGVLLFLLSMFLGIAMAQDRIIEGTITDADDKSPIIGASIVVKGTTIGTASDEYGKFSLTVPGTATKVVVSYIGKTKKEVAIPADGKLNVALESDVQNLDQVVVTALGIKKEKRALGYSVQDVKGDDLTKSGNPSALSALSGKVAGAQVTTSNGSPGAGINVRLRGATSLFGDNQPLIVIDGIPISNDQESSFDNVVNGGAYGGINGDFNTNRGVDINPDDIENISVLKGPAATALYGSLASNGAILITTKKGSATGTKKFAVDISSSITFDQVNKLPELTDKWVQGSGGFYTMYGTRSWGAKGDSLAWDGFSGAGGVNPNTVLPYDAADSAWDIHGTLVSKNDPTARTAFSPYDNMRSFFKTGITTDNSVSISGGSDRGVFRLGMTNLYQSGIIPMSSINKSTFTLSGEAKIGDKVTIAGSASYINSHNVGNLQGNNTSSVMYGVYRTPVSFDNRNGIDKSIKDQGMYVMPDLHQRSYTYYLGRDYYVDNLSIFENPYWSINRNPYSANVNRIIGNVQITADPTDWLSFMGRVGADVYSDRRKQVFDLESAAIPEGQVIEDQYSHRTINSDIIATLHHEFKHNFNGSLLIGNNVYSTYDQQLASIGDALNFQGFYNLSNAQTILSQESNSKRLQTAVYAGLNFDWNSQIYVNATARNEWSSTLARKHWSYFYPSVSASWVFTETAKLSNSKWFPYGKVRFSWAQVGKATDPHLLRNIYAQPIVTDQWTNGIQFPFTGLGGFMLDQTLRNANIKPERTNSYEAGLEMRFMNDLKIFGGFGIDFTYYFTRSYNQIINVPVANTSGFAGAILNSGTVQNQGFEIMGTITPVRVGGFRWDMNINWSKNISKVLSMPDGINSVLVGGFDGGAIHQVVGQPYGMIWGGDWVRDASGHPIIDDRTTVNGDVNSHYGLPIARADVGLPDTIIGNPNPKWLMGWRNTFSWKGLSLSFLFDVKFGGDMHNGTRGALVTYGRSKDTENRDNDVVYQGTKGHVDDNGQIITNGNNDITVHLGQIDTLTGVTYAQDWYSNGNGGGFGSVGSQFVEDASWFRMRELSLSYSFEKKLFKKTKIQGIDLSFIARNVFLVTKYKGIDPDQALTGASNVQGLEWFNLPSTRSYGFSVKFHF